MFLDGDHCAQDLQIWILLHDIYALNTILWGLYIPRIPQRPYEKVLHRSTSNCYMDLAKDLASFLRWRFGKITNLRRSSCMIYLLRIYMNGECWTGKM